MIENLSRIDLIRLNSILDQLRQATDKVINFLTIDRKESALIRKIMIISFNPFPHNKRI